MRGVAARKEGYLLCVSLFFAGKMKLAVCLLHLFRPSSYFEKRIPKDACVSFSVCAQALSLVYAPFIFKIVFSFSLPSIHFFRCFSTLSKGGFLRDRDERTACNSTRC